MQSWISGVLLPFACAASLQSLTTRGVLTSRASTELANQMQLHLIVPFACAASLQSLTTRGALTSHVSTEIANPVLLHLFVLFAFAASFAKLAIFLLMGL